MSHVLMDTNILLRGAQPSHPMHRDALDAQTELKRQGEQPCIVAQNLIEFRAVITRPVEVNGLGLGQTDADAEVARLKSIFPLFADEPSIIIEWERLVSVYGAAGKQNHDACIVAAMNVHGLTKILSFNKSYFLRYPAITVVTPSEILSAANSNHVNHSSS